MRRQEGRKETDYEATRGRTGRRMEDCHPLLLDSFPCISDAASTCPLHSHSAPRKLSRCPSIQTSPLNRLLECRGLFLTELSTSSLSLLAAGCSLEWHFTSESLSHAGSSSPSGSRTRFFRPLFIRGSASARCENPFRRLVNLETFCNFMTNLATA